MLLIFDCWMIRKDGFWNLDDNREMRKATRSVEALVEFICSSISREAGQGWNISKMHELLHITRLIDYFGSPLNFDSASCERMHKDVAKKPGRACQMRHATFNMQAAKRLADHCVIDNAYKQLVEKPNAKVESSQTVSSASGSSFVLRVTEVTQQDRNDVSYQVSIHGNGVLHNERLEMLLYPGLAEFIVAYFTKFDTMPNSIRCCSEYTDEDGTIYRAHHEFRSAGFWHDWVWTSYADDNSPEGYSNVPAKVLCFLPDGIPGNNSCHAVCHPCQWGKTKVNELISKWKLVACANGAVDGIPYDIVATSSLVGHCLIVPDLNEAGSVYEVPDMSEWANHFDFKKTKKNG